jgi:hypothetical protein
VLASPAVEAALQAELGPETRGELAQRYRTEGRMLYIPGFLSEAALAPLIDEARRVASLARRSHVPFLRRGGTIDLAGRRDRAPLLYATARSPALTALAAGVTGLPLIPRCATLCVYDRAGDGMSYHTDTGGASLSLTLALIDGSAQRFRYKIGDREHSVPTRPGTLILYDGARIRHAVSELGAGERRIILTASFVPRDRSALRSMYETLRDAAGGFYGRLRP